MRGTTFASIALAIILGMLACIPAQFAGAPVPPVTVEVSHA